MIGLLIALGILILLAIMPVGVRLQYDADGVFAWLRVGILSFILYPKKKKAQKSQKTAGTTEQKKKAKKGGSLKEFMPLLKIILDFLSETRRKLYVQNLQFCLTLADDDPGDLAIKYANAWAAFGNVMPQIERYVRIKNRDVDIRCDFEETKSTVEAGADILISLGHLLQLSLRHGFRGIKAYLKIMNKTKAVQ